MIRKIVDYQKLNQDILNLLVEKFPDGYNDGDVISFRNAKNEIIEAVEVQLGDSIYLVKIGKRLVQAMQDFGEDSDTPEAQTPEPASDMDFSNENEDK